MDYEIFVGEMDTRRIIGIIVLIIAALWFLFAPATSVTSPPVTQVIYLENIVPGIILLIIGIILVLTGRKAKPS